MQNELMAPADYVMMFESEAQLIADESLSWGSIETGGELYGLRTHVRRPVILLATPPGPHAVPTTAPEDNPWNLS